MEDSVRKTQHELNFAARKVEEAASRRYQATEWLESLVGPLGISNQPSEREFISCLRSGLVLCNAFNKIQPGSVQKVVKNHVSSESPPSWDSQPLPAYQYFENVRNFLVAAENLKLTTFEAPVLDRDNLEAGSSAKVVDCILELKAFHERKQMSGGNGFYKPQRSPFDVHSVGNIHSQVSEVTSLDPHRRLNMTPSRNKETHAESETQKLEELIIANLAECMVDKKENIDANLLASFRSGNPAAINLLCKTISSCLEEQVQNMLPEVKPTLNDRSKEECNSIAHSRITTSMESSSGLGTRKCCRACLDEGYCNHQKLFKMQENELSILKSLLSRTKAEFEDLQSQLQADMKQLGSQVQEMSTAALGYQKVVKENINLHNKVEDLKGGLEKTLKIADVSPEEMELRKELENLKKGSKRELLSLELNVLKENKSPSNKSKSMTNQTSPRPRRLSIETSSIIRRERAQVNRPKETKSLLPSASGVITPRRLSIENRYTPKVEKSRLRRLSIGTSSMVNMGESKETKYVFEKAEAIAERTPHRSRRLSNENCSTKKTGRAAYSKDKKVLKTPSAQTGKRRLSLEGSRYLNKDSANSERSGLPQAAKSTTKPKSFTSNGDSALDARLERERKIPTLQSPKTPEPTLFARGEPVEPLESQTSSMRATANGKASKIRKSLRAIGKLINGSEKRNQQKQTETPFIATNGMLDMKSPVASNATTLRRQSLAGTRSPVMSSATSLGAISNGYGLSRPITPPPVRASAKSPKQWL